VRSLVFSPNGKRLVSIGLSREILVWNTEKGESTPVPHKILFDPLLTPLTASFSPDQKIIASGTSEGKLILYDLEKGRIFRELIGHSGAILSVLFSSDGASIISAGQDKTIRYWEAGSGKSIDIRGLSHATALTRMTTNGTYVAATGISGAVAFPLGKKAGIAPVVVIIKPTYQQVVDQEKIRLSGRVVDDQGVADVRIEVNGVLSKANTGTGTRDLRVEGHSTEQQLLFDEEIHLRDGKNEITVIAFDTEGLSRTETVEVTYLPEKGELWAVIIGISKYKHVEGLKYADNDAQAFYDYLVNDNHVAKDHVILIRNEEATLQKIKDVLGVAIRGKARPQDTVVIYYAGHGAPEPDRNSPDGDGLGKYLLPYDADPKSLYSTAFPMDGVSEIFSRLAAERVILIQDTCYSGGSQLGGRTVQTASVRASLSEGFLDRVANARGRGRIIMTASEANEVSMERDDLRHGVFTFYLLEAFSKGDADQDGFITVNEAFRYVRKKVPEATGQNQHPEKKGEEGREEIVLGKVKVER